MSKQSESKLQQGYDPKAASRTCSTCHYYEYDNIETPAYNGNIYHVAKNLRCGIGGFAVKKMAVCDKWERKKC